MPVEQGAAVFEDSRNCNVSTDRALVALEGVDDLVVVATQDAVLVSRQKDANGLKRLVAKLKTVAPQVTEDHIRVHRPWGSYQSVDNGERHQVKHLMVHPGAALSLQMHHHRAEHWVVVSGEARVTVAGKPGKAMADQIMAADKSRLKSLLGALSKADLLAVEEAIRLHLGMPKS